MPPPTEAAVTELIATLTGASNMKALGGVSGDSEGAFKNLSKPLKNFGYFAFWLSTAAIGTLFALDHLPKYDNVRSLSKIIPFAIVSCLAILASVVFSFFYLGKLFKLDERYECFKTGDKKEKHEVTLEGVPTLNIRIAPADLAAQLQGSGANDIEEGEKGIGGKKV